MKRIPCRIQMLRVRTSSRAMWAIYIAIHTYSVMSSASTVTYTSVYTDSEPGRVFWGVNEELSDGGPKHPPSPNYVPGPEHPPSPIEVPYVPKPEYPDYLVQSVLGTLGGTSIYLADALYTYYTHYLPPWNQAIMADEDPEEEPEEIMLNIPADGTQHHLKGHRGEEEEHPGSNRLFAVPVVDLFSQLGAQKTIRLEPPMSPSMEARIAEYDVAPTPPSPLLPWSSPLPLIPSPPLPPPPSSLHLPPPVPTSLPLPLSPLPLLPASLSIPPPVDHKEDIPEAELLPRKRLCLTTPTLRYEVKESSTAAPRPTGGHRADYGFIGTMDADIKHQRVEEMIEERGCSGQPPYQTQLLLRVVDVLIEDRQFHHETALLLDQEALASREAWAHSVSSLQGQLSAALGQIQALQARDQTHANDLKGAASMANNMPPRRTSAATARVDAAAAAAAPITAAVVEQLIEARVYAALANHETL
ncbi:hypothetical protein Tco_0360819 [Tanacetum coccineum]